MSEAKKDETKRHTKAGMMSDGDSRAASEEENVNAERESGHIPKISKEKAERSEDDKPLH